MTFMVIFYFFVDSTN